MSTGIVNLKNIVCQSLRVLFSTQISICCASLLIPAVLTFSAYITNLVFPGFILPYENHSFVKLIVSWLQGSAVILAFSFPIVNIVAICIALPLYLVFRPILTWKIAIIYCGLAGAGIWTGINLSYGLPKDISHVWFGFISWPLTGFVSGASFGMINRFFAKDDAAFRYLITFKR